MLLYPRMCQPLVCVSMSGVYQSQQRKELSRYAIFDCVCVCYWLGIFFFLHVQQEIRLSTWDLAGQEVYYATHQCFLSRNTLYLAVWNMEKGEDGIENLRPWLLNIQVKINSET